MQTDALAAANGFTLEELQENRARRLHPRQRARFEGMHRSTVRTGRWCLGVAALLLVAAVAHGFYRKAQLDERSPRGDHSGVVFVSPVIALVLGAVPIMFGLAILRDARKLRAAIDVGGVVVGEGPLRKQTLRDRNGVHYSYVVPGASVGASEKAFALAIEGTPMRIYALAGHSYLLSLELV